MAPLSALRLNGSSNALATWWHAHAGPNFKYVERVRTGNPIIAFLAGTVVAGLALLLTLAARFGFVRKLLPLPGSGPSRKAMEAGYFDIANFSSGVDSSGKEVVVESHLKVRRALRSCCTMRMHAITNKVLCLTNKKHTPS
jgi:hypothetical protein